MGIFKKFTHLERRHFKEGGFLFSLFPKSCLLSALVLFLVGNKDFLLCFPQRAFSVIQTTTRPTIRKLQQQPMKQGNKQHGETVSQVPSVKQPGGSHWNHGVHSSSDIIRLFCAMTKDLQFLPWLTSEPSGLAPELLGLNAGHFHRPPPPSLQAPSH